MFNILNNKIITFQLILVLILVLLPFSRIRSSLDAAPEEKFIRIPNLTNKNIDTLVARITLKYTRDNETVNPDIGTGFVMTDETKASYLVSAGHVFKDALKILLDNPGQMIIFQYASGEIAGKQPVVYYAIDLIDYWKKGLLGFNEENNIDIGIIKLRENLEKKEIPQEKPETEKKIEKTQEKSIEVIAPNLSDRSWYFKYDEIDKAEDVFFFGFPKLPTLERMDKQHVFQSVIRKGIISKFLDGKKIVLEGFASTGSSGSPVFLRRQLIGVEQNQVQMKIEFRLIGIITQYFPAVLPKIEQPGTYYFENAGLALMESIDNILDTLNKFQANQKKTQVN